ncbi:hypothetical protein RUR49_24225 [Pseudoxanthobacter sp. M-2]|uniref:OsmC family protein n=1 Tax=Pseudoxanthobacter sp. M-2 TaxID=3078754 RepID=UPI0038FD36AA
MAHVRVERQEGRRLQGTARQHRVVMDRTREDGGTDAGCTSGELLLLAIGSCVTGRLRNTLEGASLPAMPLAVEVSFEPSARGEKRERIAVDVIVPAGLDAAGVALAEREALSGGVGSRMAAGSEMVVRVRREGGEGARAA